MSIRKQAQINEYRIIIRFKGLRVSLNLNSKQIFGFFFKFSKSLLVNQKLKSKKNYLTLFFSKTINSINNSKKI